MASGFLRLGTGLVCLGLMWGAMGCGSGGNAQVRVMHASPDEPEVNVLVDNNTVASNLAYGAATGYITVSSGSHTLQIEPTGTTSTIVSTSLSFASNSTSTILMANYASSLQTLVLTDNNTAPSTNDFEVRLVNAAPSLQPVDGYIVPNGTSITGMTPAVKALAFGSASSYVSLNAGTTTTQYVVYFTQAGTTSAYINTGAMTFSAGQIRTIVALNDPAGGYTSVTLHDLD